MPDYTIYQIDESELTVTDGTDTWTLIGFNVNNSTPAYATVEGIAVVGGPGAGSRICGRATWSRR